MFGRPSGCWWLLCLLTLSAAADETEAPVWRLTIDLQIVSVPTERMLGLAPRLRTPLASAAAIAEIQQMISRKEAVLVDWPILVLDAGMASDTWSKTGFERLSPAAANSFPPDPIINPLPPPKVSRQTDWTPTIFEWRGTGALVEIQEASVVGGNVILLKLAPRWVRLRRYAAIDGFHPFHGLATIIEQPEFVASHCATQALCRNGEWMFLASATDAETASYTTLYLVKCTAVRLGE